MEANESHLRGSTRRAKTRRRKRQRETRRRERMVLKLGPKRLATPSPAAFRMRTMAIGTNPHPSGRIAAAD
ncbi:hypothetical protein CGCTS75_v001916 [Colletotrichum tropicale]|nr:hypothetical protein CGCTS75_v001916 [Colletotrichum tropicale]